MHATEQALKLLLHNQRVSGWKKKSALYVAALFAGATGFVFGLFSLYLWLGTLYQPYIGAALTAAISFALAVAALIVNRFISKPAAHEQENHAAVASAAVALVENLGRELEEPIQKNPLTAVLIAGISGYAAAQKLL